MNGPVAQLVSAPPCHGGGRRFKSGQGRDVPMHRHRQNNFEKDTGGSGVKTAIFSKWFRSIHSRVAQLVERLSVKEDVVGSSPAVGAW